MGCLSKMRAEADKGGSAKVGDFVRTFFVYVFSLTKI